MSKAEMALLPCPTCPWRVNQDATTIPRYVHEKACGLLNTVGDGDAFRPIMACHKSSDENMRACNGYLAQAGWSNINVRLLVAKREIISPSKVADACRKFGVELEPDYPTVLSKLAKSITEDINV